MADSTVDIPSVVLISWAPSEYRMALLKYTVESLRKTTEIPYIFVVIDNGPTEQTNYLNSIEPDIHILPQKNIGVGAARNMGAAVTNSKYIAFIDNDIQLCDGWLSHCISLLERYEDRKLIATPMKSSPLRFKKNLVGPLDENFLYRRASGCCLVMRRRDYYAIGEWTKKNLVGGDYCERAVAMGYSYIWYPTGTARHKGRVASYHYRDTLVNGVWRQRLDKQKKYWDRLWSRCSAGNIHKHQLLYDLIKPHMTGKIADLGCGVTSLYDGGNHDVTGVDISEISIAKMKAKCPTGNWLVGDITDTKLPDNSFDTTLLVSVIEHFPDYTLVLKEAKRITKKNGAVVIVVPVKHFDKDHRHPIWNEETIEKTIGTFWPRPECLKAHNKWWIIKVTN